MANLDPLVTRTASLGKGVHVSNPPGYSKVFSIWTGSAVVVVNTVLPPHRALLITTTTALGSVIVTNSDGTNSTLTFPLGTTVVLPIQIKSYNTPSGTMFIYGLL